MSARSIGDWGFVLVIIFVAIELFAAVAEKLSKGERRKSGWRTLETIAGALLVGALAMEYVGHKRETGILDTENAEWHLEAQKAHKIASSNEVQVATVTSNNLVLKKQVAAEEERILMLEKERDSIAQQLADTRFAATNAVIAANIATDVVNNANVAVIQHLDRHLTDDQKQQLLNAVKDIPNKGLFTFDIDPNVPDSNAFSTDIARVLDEAGFKLDEGRIHSLARTPPLPIILVSTANPTNPTPLATAFVESMGKMGFRTSLMKSRPLFGLPDGEIRIDVGTKQQ
jgi:hypothetical protein